MEAFVRPYAVHFACGENGRGLQALTRLAARALWFPSFSDTADGAAHFEFPALFSYGTAEFGDFLLSRLSGPLGIVEFSYFLIIYRDSSVFYVGKRKIFVFLMKYETQTLTGFFYNRYRRSLQRKC